MEVLVAFLCGVIIPFSIQGWILYDQEQKERRKLKAFLLILHEDSKWYYDKLFLGNQPYYSFDTSWVLCNYKEFNTLNIRAMWPELMKFDVFCKNLQVFGKVSLLVQRIEMLNQRMRSIIPERHNITSAGHIEVCNWREAMNEIRYIYGAKGENAPYESSDLGSFLSKQIEMIK